MDLGSILLILSALIIVVLCIICARAEVSYKAEKVHNEMLDQQIKAASAQNNKLIEKHVQGLREADETYNRKLRKLLNRSTSEINELQMAHRDQIRDKDQKYRELLAKKKSSEVRTGYILEKVAPLFEDFPADLASDTVIPLFDVVDYLIFKDDEIIFCEIKSGDSSLSQRQKRFKQNIKEGRVSYRVFRKKAPEELENEQKTGTV